MSRPRILVELTAKDGGKVWLNAMHARCVLASDSGSCIQFGEGEPMEFREQAETVVSKLDAGIAVLYRLG